MPFLVSPSVTFRCIQAPEDLFRGVTLDLSGYVGPRTPWGIEKSLMDVTDPEVFSLLQG